MFDDVFAFEVCDVDSEPGETRYVITGIVNDVALTVVYTERGGHTHYLRKKSNEA